MPVRTCRTYTCRALIALLLLFVTVPSENAASGQSNLPPWQPTTAAQRQNAPPVLTHQERYAPVTPHTATATPRHQYDSAVRATSHAQPPTGPPHFDNQVTQAAATEIAIKNSQVDQAKIDALKEKITAATDIEEATKKESLDRLKNATEWLKTAAEAEMKSKEVAAEIESAPADIEKAKQELANPLAELSPELEPQATLAQVKQRASDAETSLKKARETHAKQEDLQRRRSEYKAELTKLIADTAARLAEANKTIAAATTSENNLADVARGFENKARRIALEKQELLYPLEIKRIEARAELLPLLKDQAKRQVAQAEKAAAKWQETLGNFRQIELERQAAEIRQQVQNAHPALKQLAQSNADMSGQRKKLIAAIENIEKEVQTSQTLTESLKDRFAKLTEKVDKVGQSTTIGLMLRRQRDQLPDVGQCRDRLQFVEESMPAIHLAALNLQDQRDALSDLDAAIGQFGEQLPENLGQQEREHVMQMVADLYQTRREMIDKLIGDYERYVNTLNELEVSQNLLLVESSGFHEYIDRHVLWIRSSEPIWKLDRNEAYSGLATLASPASWLQLGNTMRQRAIEKPWQVLIGSVALGLLLVLSHDLRRFTARFGMADEETLRLNFAPTVKATLAFLARSALWPSLMWVVGWQLASLRGMPELGRAVGTALQSAAFVFWVLYAIRRLCRRDGVGVRHFGWQFEQMKVFRRHVTWLGLTGVPVVIFVSLIAHLDEGQWNATLGRFAFVSGCALLVLFAHFVFRSSSRLFQPANDESTSNVPNGLDHTIEEASSDRPSLLRPLGYLVAVGTPAALLLLATLGYDYTAERLAARIQATIAVVLAVILFRMLALRWLAVRCNRLHTCAEKLAATQSQPQQTAATSSTNLQLATPGATTTASPAPALTATTPPPGTPTATATASTADGAMGPDLIDQESIVADPVIDLTANEIQRTDSQVRHVLKYAVAALLLVGGYTIWSDITPALGVLDEVQLWSRYVDAKETVLDAEGIPKVMSIQKEVPTTLKHAFLAVVILGLGFTLARNIPAVFELLILEHMPVDKGQRYAAGMILRYSITMAGVILACREIGLTWSSIQWLAAAMTVGLGFGLQEIFANLVSGLIILFERPIRVGDLVTAGGVTGRVTRMQIRATTITDFDRREMIVPNKKFITDDVMNWTLSDDVNRVVVEVGIAYGSDVGRARHLLVRTAKRHPLVLDDPAPSATFDKFADSTLNLTLRCFLPNLDNRLDVIHELHANIDREFRQAKIEIAFPQQDLHVRSVDDALLQSVQKTESKQKDAA